MELSFIQKNNTLLKKNRNKKEYKIEHINKYIRRTFERSKKQLYRDKTIFKLIYWRKR